MSLKKASLPTHRHSPSDSKVAVELAAGVRTTLKPEDLSAFADPREPDLGRFEITQSAADRFDI